LSLIALLSGAGYLLSKLYDIWYNNEKKRFSASKNSLTLFSINISNFVVLTLLMIFATAATAILNMRNFGKGLMAKLDIVNNAQTQNPL
jgi:uncharacterized PurR-regulated membrane protein YhhQ (DUF165 family)